MGVLGHAVPTRVDLQTPLDAVELFRVGVDDGIS